MKVKELLENWHKGSSNRPSISYGETRTLCKSMDREVVAFWKEKFAIVFMFKNKASKYMGYACGTRYPYGYEDKSFNVLDPEKAVDIIEENGGECDDNLKEKIKLTRGEFLGKVIVKKFYKNKGEIKFTENEDETLHFFRKKKDIVIFYNRRWNKYSQMSRANIIQFPYLTKIEIDKVVKGETKKMRWGREEYEEYKVEGLTPEVIEEIKSDIVLKAL